MSMADHAQLWECKKSGAYFMHQSHLTFLDSIAAAVYKKGNCKSVESKPGTFTNIGAHLEFIKRMMAEKVRSNAMCPQFPIIFTITLLVSYFISIT